MATKQLSQNTIDIVKATAPVLAEHGVTITSTMYRNMFRDHPELRQVFNPANQGVGVEKTRASQVETFSHQLFTDSSGAGKQQATLAQAIYAYAANIDNLEALTPAVLRIARKHASLDIRPEQYPIVGANVLRAIKEVLGEAATDDIMAAWQEAYEVLAELFIKLENQLREESAKKPGGWTGFRKFVVTRKVKEADNAYSFSFTPQDGGPLAPYKAGQYTCFRLTVPGYDWAPGHILHRNYTLSDFPGGDHYRVSIKREPSAKGCPDGLCSNYFHDHIQEGDVVEMAPPYGEFGLVESSLPQVFIGGGIGSTAMLSLLQEALASNLPQPLYFIQCVSNGRQHPLKQDLRAAVATHPNVTLHVCYSQPEAEPSLPHHLPGYDWAPEHILHRNYTLSDFPGGDHYRVSIKREPSAKGCPDGLCSNYFHDHIQEGDVVEMAPPYGEFGLVESSLPQVFIGGGIGSTAMLSLLQEALASNLPQPLYFIQCVSNGRQHPLKQDLRAAVATHPNVTLHVCYSQPEAGDKRGEDYHTAGRVNLALLQQILPDNQCEFYFTGPVPFMHDLYQSLQQWGVPAYRIHYECYGPLSAEVEAGGSRVSSVMKRLRDLYAAATCSSCSRSRRRTTWLSYFSASIG